MPISLIKEEEEHILRILPVLLKRDSQFKDALYDVLGETFTKKDDFAELKGIVNKRACKRTKENRRREWPKTYQE